jgi:hypothetical protein
MGFIVGMQGHMLKVLNLSFIIHPSRLNEWGTEFWSSYQIIIANRVLTGLDDLHVVSIILSTRQVLVIIILILGNFTNHPNFVVNAQRLILFGVVDRFLILCCSSWLLQTSTEEENYVAERTHGLKLLLNTQNLRDLSSMLDGLNMYTGLRMVIIQVWLFHSLSILMAHCYSRRLEF